MNILFVLYHDFTANSAGHVRPLANELVKRGHECSVAVPSNKESVSTLGTALFSALEFQEAFETGFAFSDGRGPDIVHAWTPREGVRKFCDRVRERFGCRLFVHMEDNEWHLLTCAFGQPLAKLTLLEREELDRMIPDSLSHPHRALEFLKAASGVTVIIDRLKEILPPVRATLELWPSADEELFWPRGKQIFERSALGIANNSTVVVYTGNVHAANAHDVRSLYLAIAILNREGFPATLVRTGRDFYQFLGYEDAWGREHSIELGVVPRERLPTLLAMADVLVQPGNSDSFNDYRFPSKLPEFLSAGRPVILSKTNIGGHMTPGRHALILEQSNGVAIADGIRQIMADPELYRHLSAGALEFYREHFSWENSARKLAEFYVSGEPFKKAAHTAA